MVFTTFASGSSAFNQPENNADVVKKNIFLWKMMLSELWPFSLVGIGYTTWFAAYGGTFLHTQPLPSCTPLHTKYSKVYIDHTLF